MFSQQIYKRTPIPKCDFKCNYSVIVLAFIAVMGDRIDGGSGEGPLEQEPNWDMV